MKISKRKYLFILLSIIVFAIIITIFIADIIIKTSSNGFVFNDINKIHHNKTGLLLGTSKYLKSGQKNQYFSNRITAAVNLYNAGKIDFIVISGDNSTKYYNEPMDMKKELLKNGIPEDKIFLDYAGFRTYDSVIRMNKIFGQNSFTVISQEFHNRRAIYIAQHFGLNVIGFNAKDVDVYNGFKTKMREKFARVKVFIDILTNKQPKFLGEHIEIK
ncbi:MAG: YdcF family protein [Prevotellaceae bacterium]|jgi:SanA protein|nr:YdcF family protein [Prevotellaceae bacterium]